ncbi:MAG TPA: adenylate/guanylate cyclase domain-containing protein, partial [Elusimicrobiales bacterium]|nr:adenylate/guanylate cyclase domain-containing protein [Elusimicrobiales bacterium]
SRPLLKTWILSGMVILLSASLMLRAWIKPLSEFLKTGSKSLLPEIRTKYSRTYSALRRLILGIVLVRFAALLLMEPRAFAPEALLTVTLPVMLIITFEQFCFSLVFTDQWLVETSKALESLYSEEELYKLRPGVSISLAAKLVLLVSSCAAVPFLILAVAAWRRGGEENTLWLLVMCGSALFAGLRYFMAGIQRPLDGLLEKMGEVASGNYDVKSRIYYTDEVARLKAGFNSMVDGLRERERLRETFGRYVSIEIARELLKDKKVNLGGEVVEAAVMFCDIRNFTPLSERLSPPELVEFLNNYFAAITPAIAEQRGVINKFIGDAVMAIFTPQFGSGNYAADAVRAALGMRRALAEFNAVRGESGEVRFGIGIQVGSLVAGNVGTASRLEYTFIGDTVNIASRLESKTKDFNTDVLVTRNVKTLCDGQVEDVVFESVGTVSLKGKAEPLELYKII